MKKVRKIFFSIGDWPGRGMKASINSVICFGYKWLGDKRTKCLSSWDYKEWKKDINNDIPLLKDAIKIIKQADVVVFHYGNGFDWPFLETRLEFAGLPCLPKIIKVDTKHLLKKNYFLYSNALGAAGKELVNMDKLDHGGAELWEKVSDRHKPSQIKMVKYCKRDVEVLEKIFLKARKHVTTLPNHNIFRRDGVDVCPQCGSYHLVKDGIKTRKNHIAQNWMCKDCGAYSTTKMQKQKNSNYPKPA